MEVEIRVGVPVNSRGTTPASAGKALEERVEQPTIVAKAQVRASEA